MIAVCTLEEKCNDSQGWHVAKREKIQMRLNSLRRCQIWGEKATERGDRLHVGSTSSAKKTNCTHKVCGQCSGAGVQGETSQSA
jgi:hypothetical protein